MQIVEPFEELAPLPVGDIAPAVEEGLGERALAEEADGRMQIDERAQILGDILLRDGMERDAHQPFARRNGGLAHAPIPLPVQKRLDFGEILPQLHDALEVFLIVGERVVQPTVGVIEGIEIFLADARKVLVVDASAQFPREKAQRIELALRDRGDLLPVKFEIEREIRLQVLDLGEHDLGGAEHPIAHLLRVFGEADVLEGRAEHAAALLGGSRRR